MYILNLSTCLHHGVGGLLMLLGIMLDQPFLWRHGMLTEVGGLDIRDIQAMIGNVISPPGPYPYWHLMKDSVTWKFLAMHHCVGLCIGYPLCIYFSDVYEFQYFGIIMLGLPGVTYAIELTLVFFPKENKWIHVIRVLITLGSTIWARLIFYFPALYGLLSTVYASSIPILAKCGIYFGAVLMSCFNLAI